MAEAQGCEAVRVATLDELETRLDAVLPDLAERSTPLLLAVTVAQDETFDP
jgi:thiamine pyrophosphate-dependent acetolactate synthase large subunit-like protein